MQKLAMTGLTLLLLGACASQPEDARGVGFGDYNQHLAQERAEREAALAGRQPQTVLPPAREERTDIAALAEGAIDEAEGATPASAQRVGGNTSISDEQDFEAVAGRESIESDAERLQRMQEQRVEIAPTAVPDRPGATGPNIIEYALTTSNPVGNQVFRRSPFGQGRHERNCLAYRSDDLAQEAFLSMGGPQRDRQALDPDGDGYACGWDPTVYRDAAAAARNQ
ncbi:hypothetical protein [Nioella sediminis]|jgi:hypothetical protein|uniref:hypothetical protein n=1 Tax=Nioella sediminis TaxID=1912092 RepID=UPI0008FD6899|nr:hypothetical protein [Nioella sediminis]TBX27692.1 hypothetical protein TK43_09550 [Roseovarius sp. JS7-11]